MFPDGEETDEVAEQETIRDIDFSINDIKDAMGGLAIESTILCYDHAT